MPELPEVETFITSIKPGVLNKPILNVLVNKPKNLLNSTKEEFIQFFLNEQFTSISRRGKYLLFCLTNNKSFVLHLRMEGKIIYHPHHDDPLVNDHNLVTWKFQEGEMRFYDTRQFGTLEIYYGDPLLQSKGLQKEGIEPFDLNFTSSYLKEMLSKHNKTALKTLLLDQSIIAGIGNIYADEILFDSKLNPQDTPAVLTDADYEHLVKSIKYILKEAIKYKGTTVHTFGFGFKVESGEYTQRLKVHIRQNLPCYVCGNNVLKIRVNGRGTYYCAHCQKLRGKLPVKKLKEKKTARLK